MDKEQRAITEAHYVIDNQATVRKTSSILGMSKSTIYRDITFILPRVNKKLYEKVRYVLDANKAERHIRGGESTQKRWKECN